MPRLSADERGRAVGHLEAGVTVADVARIFNCSRETIYNLQTRYMNTGSTRDRPRSGRPRVTTPAQDRYIRTTHLRDRFQSASHTARTLPQHQPVSTQTVIRRLREHGIRQVYFFLRTFHSVQIIYLHLV